MSRSESRKILFDDYAEESCGKSCQQIAENSGVEVRTNMQNVNMFWIWISKDFRKIIGDGTISAAVKESLSRFFLPKGTNLHDKCLSPP
jgi:hypothetical protein